MGEKDSTSVTIPCKLIALPFIVRNENFVWTYLFPHIFRFFLPQKMGNFDDNDDGLVFFGTIDGVHCPINEPRPFSKQWSSHKFGGKPAVNYELVVCLNKPRLAWCYGPIKPGKYNDISTFRRKLKRVMEYEHSGLRLIGDRGYRDEPELISTKNELDPEELAEFKDRASARHETFNQRLKCFKCLKVQWRHGVETHKVAFEACCALVMLQINSGSTTLFDPYP